MDDIKGLSNIKLVRLCAQDFSNRIAWNEFQERFDQHVVRNVHAQCRKCGLSESTSGYHERIRDLRAQVYLRIVEEDRLAKFRGEHENAIFGYLGLIARSTVLNQLISDDAQKRPKIDRSIDDPIPGSDIPIRELYGDDAPGPLQELELKELTGLARAYIDDNVRGQNRHRDLLILNLRLFDGLSAEEISVLPGVDLNPKAINTLVSRWRARLREDILPRENGDEPGD